MPSSMVNRPQSFYSPRHLAFRHAKRLVKAATTSALNGGELAPGQELLHSFFIPGLQSGEHTIQVDQDITAGSEPTVLSSTKVLNVINPRFTLPADAVHSTYPPQGHQDAAECLPSVVFNDPKLLWETSGCKDADAHPDKYPDYSRNRTPWLAAFVFTEDELKLSAADLAKTTGIFQKVTSLPDGGQQSSTFATNMLVSEISIVDSTVSPVQYSNATDK